MSRSAALLLALALAGCVVGEADFAAAPQSTTRTLSAADAWVRLPAAAGDVLSVVETRHGDLRAQRIVLGGTGALAGENAVTVTLPVGAARAARPTEATIAAEMAADLPGVPMRPADVLAENAAGPFAFATGRADGATCLYAWQRVGSDAAPADIRLRLCRDLPEADLVAIARAMSVAVGGGNVPAADPLVGLGGDALSVATHGS